MNLLTAQGGMTMETVLTREMPGKKSMGNGMSLMKMVTCEPVGSKTEKTGTT